jgi:hypothetical protein
MDYNVARQAVPLEELTEAAEMLIPREWERVADYGLERLTETAAKIKAGEDPDEGRELLSELMADERAMLSISTAYKHQELQVLAQFAILDLVRMGTTLTSFKKAVKDHVPKDQRASVTGLDFLTRTMGVTGLRCPEGYTVGVDGVSCEDETIFRVPVVLLRSTVSPKWTGDEVAWFEHGRWHRELVRRGVLADPRTLVSYMADRGLPIIANYAPAAVLYLEKFRVENQLDMLQSTNGFGWTEDRGSFLIGNDCLGKPALLGLQEKDRRGFGASGTWEGWCEAIKTHVAKHPRLLVGVLAAVAAPLLVPLEAAGFTLSIVGTSGSGKTTNARVAASVSGGCMMRPQEKNIQTWATSSPVGVYAMLGVANNIALILDDTKNARSPDIIHTILYAVPEGKPRVQGTTDQTAKPQQTWQTILISTGESSILDSGTKSGGAVARVIEISGNQISTPPEEVDFHGMIEDLNANSGQMIRKVAEWALAERERWPRWREIRQGYVMEMESTNGVEGRLHEHVATLRFAADICRSVGLMVDFSEALAEIKVAADRSASRANRTRQAMDTLYAWARLNENAFCDLTDRDTPHGGWVGEWVGGTAWTEIGFQQWVFYQQMKVYGFNPPDILEALEENGMVVTKKSSIGAAKLMYFKKEALLGGD